MNALRLDALDVEGADHLIVQQQGNGQRTLRVLGAGEVERVFGGVFAEIALAGRRHEAGHAVVLRLGGKLAGGRLRVHAHRQQRIEPARLLVEQADLDHVEMQQIAGEVQDVRLQQLDAVLDRHVGDLGGRQIGQFEARLMDRRHLLLLMDLVGHVADVDDQMPRRTAHLADGGGMNVVVAVVAAAERGTGGLAGGQAPCGTGKSRGRGFPGCPRPCRNSPRPRCSQSDHSPSRPLLQIIKLSLSSKTTPSGMPSRICSFCSSRPSSRASWRYSDET